MVSVLEAFVPIWALVLVGFLAARTGAFSPDAGATLGKLSVTIAMPCLLFLTLARSRPSEIVQPWLGAFALSVVIVGLGTWWVLRRAGERRRDALLSVMASSYVNSANLGIPVMLQVLNKPQFAAVVALIQVTLFTPMIIVALDHRSRAAGILRACVLVPLRNPLIIGVVAGFAWSLSGWGAPAQVWPSWALRPVELLSMAAVPASLLSLGWSLQGVPGEARQSRRIAPQVWAVSCVKVAAHPLIAFVIASVVLRLDALQVAAVTLAAGLPAAHNTFLFAQQYQATVQRARDYVLVSTAMSMVTLTLIAALLAPAMHGT